MLISKRMVFVFELQHPIDPLRIALSRKATDLGIIYGSLLTLTFPWEIGCQICTHRTDKLEVTAIIRVERLAVFIFNFFVAYKDIHHHHPPHLWVASFQLGCFSDSVLVCHY